ncbi:hypothetical protein BpHYR1_022413 [Brachionus plicatilis]|uniref:Uncharacterized protein n=1 Tax=Brachionus plicatilis TaxID=10195 RepID=A0A3M7QC99_BRAPC|nr:hypothetical protein BpHYR1_022413 [Brachionus plicatilis]
MFLPDLLNFIALHFLTLKNIGHVFDHSESVSRSCFSVDRSLVLRIVAISLLSSANSLTRWYFAIKTLLRWKLINTGKKKFRVLKGLVDLELDFVIIMNRVDPLNF